MAITSKVKTWLTKTLPRPAVDRLDESPTKELADWAPAPCAERRWQIVKEFERCLKNRRSVSEIHDESVLPYTKRETLDAISLEILLEDDAKKIEALKASAIFLADFQKGVGAKPLTLLGISDLDLLDVDMHALGDLDDPVTTIRNNPDREKYKALRRLADHELAYILSRIAAVLELKHNGPDTTAAHRSHHRAPTLVH